MQNAQVVGLSFLSTAVTLHKSSPRSWSKSASVTKARKAPEDSQSIWHVSPNNKGYLLFSQFLNRNLKRVRLSLQINKYRRIHTIAISEIAPQVTPFDVLETHLICKARVPKILALSYLVMYGVVCLSSFGIFLSFGALSLPVRFAAAEGSPDSTIPVSLVGRS